MRVCSGINYEKLSSEVTNHIAQNIKIPPKLAAEALVSQQCKLKSLLEDTDQPKPVMDSTCSFVERECTRTKNKTHEQIVLYARKLNLSDENKKLKVHLQGMQWRVLELEKVCKKMHTQMTKMMKSRLPNNTTPKSIPRLC